MLSTRFECGAPTTAMDEILGAPDQATATQADEMGKTRALYKFHIQSKKINK